MASLAPGNGWFPHRRTVSHGNYSGSTTARRQAGQDGGNVYALRRFGVFASLGKGGATGSVSSLPDLVAMNSSNDSRTAAAMLAWGVFAAVIALILWVGCIAAFAGGAVAMGVPWTTVAIALIAVHVLAGVLFLSFCSRVSRSTRDFPSARASLGARYSAPR